MGESILWIAKRNVNRNKITKYFRFSLWSMDYGFDELIYGLLVVFYFHCLCLCRIVITEKEKIIIMQLHFTFAFWIIFLKIKYCFCYTYCWICLHSFHVQAFMCFYIVEAETQNFSLWIAMKCLFLCVFGIIGG